MGSTSKNKSSLLNMYIDGSKLTRTYSTNTYTNIFRYIDNFRSRHTSLLILYLLCIHCPLGSFAAPTTVTFAAGQSLVVQRPLTTSSSERLSLSFRTLQKDGQLFSTSRHGTRDVGIGSLGLQLKDGRLSASANLGSGSKVSRILILYNCFILSTKFSYEFTL